MLMQGQAYAPRVRGGCWRKLAPRVGCLAREECKRVNQHAQWSLRPGPARQRTTWQCHQAELQMSPHNARFEIRVLLNSTRLAVAVEHQRHGAKRHNR